MFQFGNRLIFVFKNFPILLLICYTSVKIKSKHFCNGKIHTVKAKRYYTVFICGQSVFTRVTWHGMIKPWFYLHIQCFYLLAKYWLVFCSLSLRKYNQRNLIIHRFSDFVDFINWHVLNCCNDTLTEFFMGFACNNYRKSRACVSSSTLTA